MKETIGAGPRIRLWRKQHGLKAYQLAEKIRIAQSSLSEIETGIGDPSARTIRNLHIYTDIDICWVLTGEASKAK